MSPTSQESTQNNKRKSRLNKLNQRITSKKMVAKMVTTRKNQKRSNLPKREMVTDRKRESLRDPSANSNDAHERVIKAVSWFIN